MRGPTCARTKERLFVHSNLDCLLQFVRTAYIEHGTPANHLNSYLELTRLGI